MNENAQKLNAVMVALLILSSILGVAVLNRGKTGSPRPPQTGSERATLGAIQTVPNRLWQDPFEALDSLTNDNRTATNSKRTFREQTTSPATVLAVFLEGAPYPEDKETRRRLRYAVELALLTSQFAPDDRSHIGVENLPLGDLNEPGNQKLAFEWFTRTVDFTRVLILWLPEEEFASRPLARLDALWKALALPAHSELVVIGPRSSDTLRSMALEDHVAAPLSNLCSFRILSPHATAPDSALFGDSAHSDTDRHRKDLQARFHRNGVPVSFQTWTATDRELSLRIAEELALRDIPDKHRTNDVVVLISEADTFYGRALPLTLQTALTEATRFRPNNIWNFKYLRGLEGLKAATSAKEDQKKLPSAPEDVLQAMLTRESELAEGESQQDYARRFAAFLKSKESRYSRTGIRIRAIGLTGSDFYDKLVLLQALRPRFPEAVFLPLTLMPAIGAIRSNWNTQETC